MEGRAIHKDNHPTIPYSWDDTTATMADNAEEPQRARRTFKKYQYRGVEVRQTGGEDDGAVAEWKLDTGIIYTCDSLRYTTTTRRISEGRFMATFEA